MIFYNLLFAIATLSQEVFAVDIKKLFYEKDLSEYCKRRVIPSIFLGRHVVEASSFILHFTKLNMPYNCFISIRAEAGSNMIMVITLPEDASLKSTCAAGNPQLQVYEMGETFGGYWGMLPDLQMLHIPPKTRFYTLKTTQPTTAPTEPSTEEYIETTIHTPAPNVVPDEDQDYIRVEVPIVDVSGKLVPGSAQPRMPLDFEESFDYQYDVTPIPGVKYDTSILPLVQLSVRKQTDDGRRDDGQEPRYELDVVEEFTPDPRLTLPRFTISQNRRTNANRRLIFGKVRGTKRQSRKNYRISLTKSNRLTKYVFPTTMPPTTKHNMSPARDSWELIGKLMETLKKNKEDENNDRIRNKNYMNTSRIAENISNMKHNFSKYLQNTQEPVEPPKDRCKQSIVYLEPNLSVYNYDKSSNLLPFSPIQTIAPLPPRTTNNPFRKMATTLAARKEKQATNINQRISLQTFRNGIIYKTTTSVTSPSTSHETYVTYESFSTEYYDSQENVTFNEESSNVKVIEIPNGTVPPVSLVDHESWENIVQAAPGMAVLLNQTVLHNVVNRSDDGWSSLNETYRKELLQRKKRAIQPIAIESGRPHNLTTKEKTPTTTRGVYDVEDMQEFARLVELQDDDVHGRVALRYLKQYVGPAIYNICGNAKSLNRQVYLFNSSRVVLSLNNFSLSRMSVILTGAKTLLSSEIRCPTSQLECQVSGARVCVDSLAACDGVPNCGSFDIYDEDRLMCGVAVGLQHNVYLAAFTFLAFVLTLFYAVHYWLKRCVPEVADAFFVYIQGVENVLYLDSVMRPPGDYDDGSRMFYHGNMYDDSLLNTELKQKSKKKLCLRIFRKCFYWFRKVKESEEGDDQPEQEIITPGSRKTYSFTQMELSSFGNRLVTPTVDTSVQTGDSLEMAIFEEQSELQVSRNRKTSGIIKDKSVGMIKDPPTMIRDSLLTLDEPLPEDELSLMKFFRESRSDSSDSMKMEKTYQSPKLDLNTGAAPGGEREISNTMYDGGIKRRPGPSGLQPKPKPKAKPNRAQKQIRFEEDTTMISPNEFSDDDDVGKGDKPPRNPRQVFSLGQTRTWRSQHLSTINEDDESGSRHRHHFWESKGKKSSKKANVSLR